MGQRPFELRILGPTELKSSQPGSDSANPQPPKRLALLAYLALETAAGFRRRDQIVGLFWPDLPQEGARTQLRKALFSLREALGADAVVSRGEGEVRLDHDRVWCDAVALGQYLREGRWSEALALYRGELLEGLFPEGVAQEFEEWLAEKRKALRAQAATAAWECSRIEEELGDRKAAAVLARRALDLTPDDESGVRQLMSLLDRQGDRGAALRVYSEWQARLQSEYGVEPAPETRKLARKVQAARKGESHETPPTQQPIPPVSPQLTLAPGGRTRWMSRRATLATSAVLVVGAAVVGALLLGGRVGTPAASPRSVAILPIHAIGDPGPQAAAEAITEELTTALVLVPGLVVRPAARVRDAAPSRDEISRIARRLGAAYVVEGGAQRGEENLRITLRLVRASDAVAVWAGSYDAKEGAGTTVLQRMANEAAAAIRDRIFQSDSLAR